MPLTTADEMPLSVVAPDRLPGTAGEVAQLAAFLVSDAAAYITGAEYVIDGGNNKII